MVEADSRCNGFLGSGAEKWKTLCEWDVGVQSVPRRHSDGDVQRTETVACRDAGKRNPLGYIVVSSVLDNSADPLVHDGRMPYCSVHGVVAFSHCQRDRSRVGCGDLCLRCFFAGGPIRD